MNIRVIKGLILFVMTGLGFLFVNMTMPDFPLRNVDTRTIQYKNGLVTTMTPHIPMHDMTLDGRVGLRRKGHPNYAPFYVLTPEKVNKHVKDMSNAKVGANLLMGTPYN